MFRRVLFFLKRRLTCMSKPPHNASVTVCKTFFVWFRKGELEILLRKHERLIMQQTLHVDQIDTLSIVQRDASGNVVNVPYDAPPTWTSSNPAAATLTVAADGLTATLTNPAVDQVTDVTVQASIAGTVFSATNTYTIVGGAVASIEIKDTFAPKP